MKKDAIDYIGFIFIGLMKLGNEPYVIEYNCRLGDPETEVIVPRIKNDVLELFQAACTKKLEEVRLNVDQRYATTIVAVSGGYPNSYEKGYQIRGLEKSEKDTILFHSGTKEADGKIVTNGGRVLCATGLDAQLSEAINKSKALIEAISYEGKYFRRDIGYEFV
ncbi:MAG: phosphoribosylglycinamide synthetase C domain-containing protein [Flavisolibacter sp.]